MNPQRHGVPDQASEELVPSDGQPGQVIPFPANGQWYTPPFETHEWLVARPPYHPDSDFERYWSNTMVWPRRAAIGFMWLTYRWWRTGLAMATLVLLWAVFFG